MTLTQINKAGLDELALDHVFTIGASGSDHYTFQGEGLNGTVNDPTLYLTRGKTYRFENGTGAHPIRIQSTSGASGTAYNTGVTNNAGSGTVIVEVQHDAPDVLYYQCTSHANMNGVLYITGALADGGVTTAKLADDAVTDAKLANSINASIAANTAKNTNATHTGDVTGSGSLTIASNAVTTAKIADGAVTTAKIANNAVTGDKLPNSGITFSKIQDVPQNRIAGRISSGSGVMQELTAANVRSIINVADGATNSTSTTINNNADNRIISGSGTANTLTAESNLHAVNGRLLIGATSEQTLPYTSSGAIQTLGAYNTSSINIVNNENSGNTSALTFNKIRGASGSAGGTDNMGGINWGAYDGSAWRSGITVEGKLTSIGSNAVPSKLTFKVNSGSSNTERFAITPNGVTFNGDTAAANALDDYEEGTFTPQIRFGGNNSGQSYSSQMGYYTKIGNRVIFHLYIHFSNKGSSSGNAKLYNLPYTSANVSVGYAHVSCWINSSNYGNTIPTAYVPHNTSYIQLERQRTDGGGVYSVDNTNFNSNTDMMISGSYRV